MGSLTLLSELAFEVAELVKLAGIPLAIDQQSRAFTDSDYDVATFAKSGTTILGSALFFPISGKDNEDKKYLEDGRITLKDKKIYIYSGLNITQDADMVIDSGSYNPILVENWGIQGGSVYSKIYIRSKFP